MKKKIYEINPSVVYTTPYSDFHKDHQKIHECTLVATRPVASKVQQIFSYEIPGTVKTAFSPNYYIDISKELTTKIRAFKQYTTEIQKFPHPRSPESIQNLAIHRGIEAGIKNAEAFRLIRYISS